MGIELSTVGTQLMYFLYYYIISGIICWCLLRRKLNNIDEYVEKNEDLFHEVYLLTGMSPEEFLNFAQPFVLILGFLFLPLKIVNTVYDWIFPPQEDK